MTTDRLVRSTGVHLAQRFTRRSVLGRTATAVASLGAAGAGYAFAAPEMAQAAPCSGLSETCNNLLGYNHCPSYTCYDGWWTVSGGPCGGTTYWQDCCVSYANCPGGCHCHNGHPTCCNNCNYCVRCCGVVRCRRWFC
jgi:hypothetical protein